MVEYLCLQELRRRSQRLKDDKRRFATMDETSDGVERTVR
ncbi:hypothetical protein GA0070560_1092 [Micromonospora halophytica]|uniref:Uncharacterized protein n=1 Tax=Micromonospora halophytica TaxID=47864 RepID=A0A1C5I9T2_9ACTN|nr:hypothetical protein GA0070560_1092 [Micromonospora halophytica]